MNYRTVSPESVTPGRRLLTVGSLAGLVAVAVAAALLGMASGRLVGRLFDKPSGFYPIWLYFWVELLGGGLLIATLRW